jgi:hypothetical protein
MVTQTNCGSISGYLQAAYPGKARAIFRFGEPETTIADKNESQELLIGIFFRARVLLTFVKQERVFAPTAPNLVGIGRLSTMCGKRRHPRTPIETGHRGLKAFVIFLASRP